MLTNSERTTILTTVYWFEKIGKNHHQNIESYIREYFPKKNILFVKVRWNLYVLTQLNNTTELEY